MLLRQQPEYLHLPIVFLTGDPDPERQFEVLESGADDFLNKPIRPRHLIAAVSNRIQRARQRNQALQSPRPAFLDHALLVGVEPDRSRGTGHRSRHR
jgi:DNA-binding response OmpR family regulator